MFSHVSDTRVLTFGLVCKHIRQPVAQATAIAPNARGHISTTSEHQNLSLNHLMPDYIKISHAVLGKHSGQDTILSGHSMGGAVMAHATAPRRLLPIRSLVLIDIVKATALDSLHVILSFYSRQAANGSRWSWKTQSMPTKQCWRGWYTGLSKTFVSAQTARLLILAGLDRLDKELLIAQMQGEFQLELLPAAGHAIRENLPDMVGDVATLFWKRN
ncbi:Protein phosphatase methylesterase 1 [Kickxella alabastrina]|nr:Protein phosphatase methylesterase 1 [Kickxella alabastrina]